MKNGTDKLVTAISASARADRPQPPRRSTGSPTSKRQPQRKLKGSWIAYRRNLSEGRRWRGGVHAGAERTVQRHAVDVIECIERLGQACVYRSNVGGYDRGKAGLVQSWRRSGRLPTRSNSRN